MLDRRWMIKISSEEAKSEMSNMDSTIYAGGCWRERGWGCGKPSVVWQV